MLDDKPINFKTNLAEALGMGHEIIAKYKEYSQYMNRDIISCIMECKGTELGLAEVEFNEYLDIEVKEFEYKYNPNQLQIDLGINYLLTSADLKMIEYRSATRIEIGECNFCNATHIRCACGEEHASYGNVIECDCGRSFTLDNGVELLVEQ